MIRMNRLALPVAMAALAAADIWRRRMALAGPGKMSASGL
jgi:hypothetical protein